MVKERLRKGGWVAFREDEHWHKGVAHEQSNSDFVYVDVGLVDMDEYILVTKTLNLDCCEIRFPFDYEDANLAVTDIDFGNYFRASATTVNKLLESKDMANSQEEVEEVQRKINSLTDRVMRTNNEYDRRRD